MKRKEHSTDDFENQPELKKAKIDETTGDQIQGQGDESVYHQFSNVGGDNHNQHMYLSDYSAFNTDSSTYPQQQINYVQQYPTYTQQIGESGVIQPTDENAQYPLYQQTGYPYIAYMTNNGKYEPVLIYYDQDGQPRVQHAPELQEQLQDAMQQQYHPYIQDIYEPQSESRKKSTSSSDNQEKASVTELAKRVGLLKNEHKEWRFRDQKRTLLLKLSNSHIMYIENSSLDEILLRRLPHKITPTEFAKRIWLLVFHTVVAEGNTPKFWDRVTDREYLENQLDEEFKTLRSPQFANEVFNALTKHECSIQEAINSVAFRHPRTLDHYESQAQEYTHQQETISDPNQTDTNIHYTSNE